MKIRITLKDPDGVSNSIIEAAEDSLVDLDLSPAEKDAVVEIRHERVSEEIAPWVTYGEYVTIVIDTEEGTATVVKT